MQSEYSPRDAREPTQGNAFPHGRFTLSAERPRAASSTSEEVHEIVRSPARELEPDQCDSRSERGSAQNCKAGKEPGACKEPGALTSVETLISRQRSASAARAASAWPAYLSPLRQAVLHLRWNLVMDDPADD